jgi:Post-segregation antitoxin CcdA
MFKYLYTYNLHGFMKKIIDSSDINEQKQKLTLGISKDVIRRAKAAGINISAITEELLTAITYEPNDCIRRDDVVRAYEALFSAAESIMIPYDDFAVEIGFQRVCNKIDNNITWKEYTIMLTTQGLYRITDSPNDLEDVTVDKVLRWLYEPKKFCKI